MDTTEHEVASRRDRALLSGKIIRPIMTIEKASQFVKDLYGLKVLRITEINSYFDRNYKVEVSSEDIANANIKETWPHGYVLKILNSWDSKLRHIEAEHEVQKELHAAGISCSWPVLDKQGQEYSLQEILQVPDAKKGPKDGNLETTTEDQQSGMHIVRLLAFIPGDIIADVPHTPGLYVKAGQMLAKIDNVLQGYSHSALKNYQTLLHIKQTPMLRDFLDAVEDQSQKDLFNSVWESYDNVVLPLEEDFKRGVIHGDFSDQNILVHKLTGKEDNSEEYLIAGIIDFGEMTDSYYFSEVATSITYMSIDSTVKDPLDVGGYFLAGLLPQMPLNHSEWKVLKECVCFRVCVSLLFGICTYKNDPSNTYSLTTSKKGWNLLKKVWETPKRDLYLRWQKIIKELDASIPIPELEDII